MVATTSVRARGSVTDNGRQIDVSETGWTPDTIRQLMEILDVNQNTFAAIVGVPPGQIWHHLKSPKKNLGQRAMLPHSWRALLRRVCEEQKISVKEGTETSAVTEADVFDESPDLATVEKSCATSTLSSQAPIIGSVTMPSRSSDVQQLRPSPTGSKVRPAYDIRNSDQGVMGPLLTKWLKSHKGIDHLYLIDGDSVGITFADTQTMSPASNVWFAHEQTRYGENNAFVAQLKPEPIEGNDATSSAERDDVVMIKKDRDAHRMFARVDEEATIILVAVSVVRGDHFHYFERQIQRDMNAWCAELRSIFAERDSE